MHEVVCSSGLFGEEGEEGREGREWVVAAYRPIQYSLAQTAGAPYQPMSSCLSQLPTRVMSVVRHNSCCGRSAAHRCAKRCAPKVCANLRGHPTGPPQYSPRRNSSSNTPSSRLVSSRLELELATSYGYLKEVSANLR